MAAGVGMNGGMWPLFHVAPAGPASALGRVKNLRRLASLPHGFIDRLFGIGAGGWGDWLLYQGTLVAVITVALTASGSVLPPAASVIAVDSNTRERGKTAAHYLAKLLSRHGNSGTVGVAPGTVSNAESMVRLAMADMTLPAFRDVVAMPQVTLPIAGLQYNVNAMLGKDGIIGVKTGFTTSAGGCFVFATTTKVGTATTTVVGAVLGQPSTPAQPSALTAAFDATTALIPTVGPSLTRSAVVHQGQTLGTLRAPWTSAPVPLRAARGVSVLGLTGERVHTTVKLPAHVATPVRPGEHIGSAVVAVGASTRTVPLEAGGSLGGPSLRWRLSNV